MKSRYHPHKVLRFMIVITALLTGIYFGILTSRADSLPFGDALTGMFPGIENNNSSVWFQYGGNNFAGMIFWTNRTTLPSPEPIVVSGGTQTVYCYKKLNGIYYNNQRGRTIWPLDTGSLQTLRAANPSYNSLNMIGGFYTYCTSGAGYTPGLNDIYGQIDHSRSGTQFHMLAGLSYNFAGNTISGSSLSPTLFVTGSNITGHIFDSQGGIGFIGGTGQGCIFGCQYITGGICNNFTGNSAIPFGQNGSFTCTANAGNTISGYIINIFSNPYGPAYTNQINTSANQYTLNTGNTLPQGNYIVTCTILGIGTGAGGQCGPNLLLTVGTSQVYTGLGGDFEIPQIPGLITQASPAYYYVRTTSGININVRSYIPSYYTISSPNMTNTIAGYYNYSYNPPYENRVSTGTIYLTAGEGQKIIYSTFSTGTQTIAGPIKYITLDLTPPSTPSIINPTNGTGVCYIGDFNLSWTGASDGAGVGITSYYYQIFNNSNFTSPIISVNTNSSSSSATVNAGLIGTNYFSGTYYWSVQAIDGLLQTGGIATGYFNISPIYCASYGNIFIHGIIPRIRNADLNKYYISDPFSIENLPGSGFYASLDTGTLYINGLTGTTTGLVNNNDTLQIGLTSSSQYDTARSTTITIGPKTATFSIFTKSESSGDYICTLTNEEKLIINNIFDMLKDAYAEDPLTQSEFFLIMKSMLEDEVDLTKNCSLDYLIDIINSYITDQDNEEIDESDHKAPNCKLYKIKYSSAKDAYTSTTMRNRTYFASREALIQYIDSKNPGDCRLNSYDELPAFDNDAEESGKRIAPNGKVYEIKEKTLSGTDYYYSTDFIKIKYFENLEDLQNYIDINNPTFEIRDHEVDEDFDPEDYIAPNGKEYKIYSTDRGYMAYKLMKVQYFDTLEDIKYYIDKNNR